MSFMNILIAVCIRAESHGLSQPHSSECLNYSKIYNANKKIGGWIKANYANFSVFFSVLQSKLSSHELVWLTLSSCCLGVIIIWMILKPDASEHVRLSWPTSRGRSFIRNKAEQSWFSQLMACITFRLLGLDCFGNLSVWENFLGHVFISRAPVCCLREGSPQRLLDTSSFMLPASIFSVESQKGALTIQWCSFEIRKGAITVQSLW